MESDKNYILYVGSELGLTQRFSNLVMQKNLK